MNSFETMANGLPFIRLSGPAYQRGWQRGQAIPHLVATRTERLIKSLRTSPPRRSAGNSASTWARLIPIASSARSRRSPPSRRNTTRAFPSRSSSESG